MRSMFRDVERFCRTLLLWLRNRPQREYEWMFSVRYWKLRHFWETVQFEFRRRIFEAAGSLRSIGESWSILESILGVILNQLLLAIVIVATLSLFERQLDKGLQIGTFFFRLALGPPIDSSTLREMLGGLAQIAGVFLGLYFTAVGVTASTTYAHVTVDVRSLLVREKIGSFYIRLVALFGAVAILRLGFVAAGFAPGMLTLAVVTLLGMTAILSFVSLGMRAFKFFDPSSLAGYIVRDLISCIESSTQSGLHSRNPRFQSYYQRKAENLLTTYHNLVSVVVMDSHLSAQSLENLATSALELQRIYSTHKPQISSDSHWFKRTHMHPEWFVTDSTQLRIALDTGTSLQPELVPDFMWVEHRIAQIQSQILKCLLEQKTTLGDMSHIESVQRIIIETLRTLQVLSSQFAVAESLLVLKGIVPLVLTKAHELDIGPEETKGEVELQRSTLALLGLCSMGLTGILIGFSESLGTSEAPALADVIRAIDLDRASSVHLSRWPRDATKQVEYVAKRLDFERTIEGHVVTSHWYVQQSVATGFVRFVSECVESLVGELERLFSNEADRFAREKRYVLASEIIERGIEACNKYRFHLKQAKQQMDSLTVFRVIPDVTWPVVDWNQLDTRITNVYEQLLVSAAQILQPLGAIPRQEYLPDYFGHLYSVLASECYGAMAEGKEELFLKLFPFFFSGWQSAFRRLPKKWITSKEERLLILVTEPLVDILELSGYAFVYSELHADRCWNTVRRLWNNYLSRLANPRRTLKGMIDLLDYRQLTPLLLPRDVIRTSWKMNLERMLREQDLLDESVGRIRHGSPVIRALGTDMVLYDLRDVFICVYLARWIKKIGLKHPRSSERFAASLKAERVGTGRRWVYR